MQDRVESQDINLEGGRIRGLSFIRRLVPIYNPFKRHVEYDMEDSKRRCLETTLVKSIQEIGEQIDNLETRICILEVNE